MAKRRKFHSFCMKQDMAANSPKGTHSVVVSVFAYSVIVGSSVRVGMIGVTEPRRVAAVSMSKRVAHEMSLPTRLVHV